MGYCTIEDVRKTIAQSLTSATADSPDDFGSLGNLLNIGNSFDRNLVTDDTVYYYIQVADQEVDSLLSELYVTPFCEKIIFEGITEADIDNGNSYVVTSQNCPITVGDTIILKYEDGSGVHEERHEIADREGNGIYSTVDEISYYFPADSRLLKISYPEPLRYISARISSAAIYDKYFSSEASPNMSKYGDTLRNMAYNRINDIVAGRIIIHGAHRIGRRMFNPTLSDQYGIPEKGDVTGGTK